MKKLLHAEMGTYAAPELPSPYPAPREPGDLAVFPYIHMTILIRASGKISHRVQLFVDHLARHFRRYRP